MSPSAGQGSSHKAVPIESHVPSSTLEADKYDDASKYKGESDQTVSFSHYVRIFSYARGSERIALSLASLASIGAGITLPLMIIIFGRLIGSFNSFFTPGNTSTLDSFTKRTNNQALYLVYIWIGKFVLCYVSIFAFKISGIRISAAIRLAYLQALFAKPISVLDKLAPGSAASNITSQANILQNGISEKLATFLQSIAMVISAYVVAFIYSWQLTLVTSSVLLFVTLLYGGLVPFVVKAQKSKDHADSQASAISSEVFSSIRMVAACGAEGTVSDRFRGWVEESRRRGLKMSPMLGLQLSPFFFALYSNFALTFWFGIRLYIWHDIENVANVLIVLMSVMLSVSSLGHIVAPIMAASKAAGAASSFFTVIDSPSVCNDGLSGPQVSPRNDIHFKNVSFAYPSRPHVKVLDDLNVSFKVGKLTAIVGPSGSGKSTVVGLLERWYELETAESGECDTTNEKKPVEIHGSIMLAEDNIRQLNLKWWRSQIGLVQQEPFIFDDTIENNVARGLIGSVYEDENQQVKEQLVREACKKAFADEFIDRLPQGYGTLVGDSGIKLSGGQRQRLAIARSIVKRPQILIFDEATSSIDVKAERKVQEALDRVAKNRTAITIAHRLSTIRKADTILVLSKGRLVEEGTHEELISKHGVYYGLVHAQSLVMEPSASIEEKDSKMDVHSAVNAISTQETIDHKTKIGHPEAKVQPELRGVFGSFGLLLVEQKKHIVWLYLTFLGAFGAAVAQPLQAYLMANLVTIFQYTNHSALLAGAAYWSLRFVYLAIGVAAGYFIIGWASNSFSVHISSTYRQEYFGGITRQPIRFFDDSEHSVGTLVSRVSSDPTQLNEMMGINMALAMIAVLSIIGCVAIAFAYGWKLTLVAIFSSMPIILVASYLRYRFEIQYEKMNATVFAESSKFAAEAIGAFRTVTSLTLEDSICTRYAVLLRDHIEEATRKARLRTLVYALSDSINLLCMALTFWYGGKLLASREYSPLDFLVIYVAIIQGSESAGQWMSLGPNFAQATAASNRILEFRTTPASEDGELSFPEPESHGARLEFRDVYFTYPTRDTPIFQGLSITFEPGKFTAIVGPSGCGKTSIISLLEQFYHVQQGSILFNGADIQKLDLAIYRKQFSLVAQEPGLFQGTIKENLLLGVQDPINDEAIFEACRGAEIHTFIKSLPEGYATDIGSRGVALSGGQKQRLAIARALIRKPLVLLLDEATSSLDSESENSVQAAFEKAGKGRTMVVVAHRLATIQNADCILVLGEAGSVVEKGTHQQLVDRRGVYWQMCQSQALDW